MAKVSVGRYYRPGRVPAIEPASGSEADNLRAVLIGLFGRVSGPRLRCLGFNSTYVNQMINGQYRVSRRLVRLIFDNWQQLRDRRLAELKAEEEAHKALMTEKRALLNWGKHHIQRVLDQTAERDGLPSEKSRQHILRHKKPEKGYNFPLR